MNNKKNEMPKWVVKLLSLSDGLPQFYTLDLRGILSLTFYPGPSAAAAAAVTPQKQQLKNRCSPLFTVILLKSEASQKPQIRLQEKTEGGVKHMT